MPFLRRLGLALLLAAAAPFAAPSALPPALHAQTLEAHLSDHAMRHILARHGPGSLAADAGKFAHGTDEAAIRAMILEAIRDGRPRHDTRGRPDTLFDYRFPASIGVTADGRPTRRLRVVVAPDGEIVTAYPR
jgi:hypothetical protein